MRSIVLAALCVPLAGTGVLAGEPAHPNILWITSEDNGPHLGCYGDTFATTPNLDALAARGVIYLNAWSSAPVCAPARTAIVTGVSPTSLGAEHMRSMVPLPAQIRMYPQILRAAGYYCTNNVKEDYNVEKPGLVWDESSRKAHWRNRKAGQPFFAVFNHTVTHESQIRARPHKAVHDPARVPIPAYHPEAPEVRQDWAQYYDKLTEMDALAGANLRELAEAGLAEDTIVFYYGDHGPGMPRCKRSPCNSGLRVPLIVYIPEKFRHLAASEYAPGAKLERLVSFEDLAATAMSLAGVPTPDWMQGRAFLGPHAAAPRRLLYGFRGRMDERYDLVRSVRDERYVYVRNFMPHLPAGQHNAYMFETPTTRVWKRLFDEGKLTPAQRQFWERKAPEELYDLQADRDEVNNLAGSPEHRDTLERLRRALHERLLDIRDVGFLPEGEIHARSRGRTPYELARDDAAYPLEEILAMAELASGLDPGALPQLRSALRDAPDSAVRRWSALGILMRGSEAARTCTGDLQGALRDASPYVRIAAAESLGQFGGESDRQNAMSVLLELADARKHNVYIAMAALNAIDALRPVTPEVEQALKALPRQDPSAHARLESCIGKLLGERGGL